MLLALQLGGCAEPGLLPKPLGLLGAAGAGLRDDAATPFPDAQWWRALGAPALDALVEQALAGQPSLDTAAARLTRAAAVVDATLASQGLQAGLGLDLTRQRFSQRGLVPPALAGKIINVGNLQASASFELDFFGRHQAALQAAVGQQQAARVELQAARVLLVANVARAYVSLARLASLQALAQRSLEQRQTMLELTRSRVRAGLDSAVELRLAESGLPEVRGQIESLTGQMMLVRHQLALLSGQAPRSLDGLVPALLTMPGLALPDRLGADLLGRRADVVAARWRVEAALQDVEVARGQFYPDINLMGFAGLNSLGLDHLLTLGSRSLGAGPALRLPLFDGGRLRANLLGRAAEADAAVAAYNTAVLEAAREVADAAANWQSTARQQAEQAQTQALTESAYELAQQRYRAGLGNQLLVLNAETSVLAQRNQGAELRARALDAQVSLMRALGGGWRDDKPAPAALLPVPGALAAAR